MKKTVDEILQESRELRSAGFLQPAKLEGLVLNPEIRLPWIYYSGRVLAPVGSSFSDLVLHLYFDETPDLTYDGDPDFTIIVHGHSRTGFCNIKTLCHVIGFRLSGEENPIILRRWKEIYGD